jgi:hypothetical protein
VGVDRLKFLGDSRFELNESKLSINKMKGSEFGPK